MCYKHDKFTKVDQYCDRYEEKKWKDLCLQMMSLFLYVEMDV
jgi:hypothetical protein